MKSVIDMGKWASAAGRHALAFFLAIGLLALLRFLLIDQLAVAQAPRAIEQVAIEVNQTVGTSVGICTPTAVIAAENTQVHYCVIILNTGSSPLTQHVLSSSLSSKPITFTQPIEPGEAISLTTNILNELAASGGLLTHNILANPIGTTITHTVFVTSTNGIGDVATGRAAARVVIGRVGLNVVKTVGLGDSCAATKGVAVNLNTPVKYCVTMQNTGTLPLIYHRLIDSLLSVNVPFTLSVPAGATLVITDGALRKYDNTQRLEFFVTDNLTNTMTFNSATVEGIRASAQDQAVARIGQASIALTDTLGLDATTCGTSSAIAVVSGRTIYHCLRIKNEGTIPLETHDIRSTTAPIVSVLITETLQPGQSLVLTNTRIAQLTQANVTANTTINFAVTSRMSQGIVATDSAQAQVTIGTQTITLLKYATTDPNGCVATSPLNIVSNQAFYYCLIVTNTGTVPLVRHTFTEGSPLNLNGAFTYSLAPTQRMTLTNQFLINNQFSARLGPFASAASLPGTLTFTSFSEANASAAVNASFQINIVAATPTLPPTSTPFPTFTPTISPTPSLTPIIPPTPTVTPIVVSLPATPGQPFGVNAVTTPTPGVGAGSASPLLDAFGQPVLTLVPVVPVDMQSTVFAQTAEAAATQTAWAFIPPPVVDTPIPPPTTTPFVESLLESPLPSPTLFDGIPTATPLAFAISPLATPEFLDSYLDVIAHVLQVSTATLGWIWFFGGSIVFFATAGMFLGLSWLRRHQRQGVYDVNAGIDLPDDSTVPASGPVQSTNPKPPNDEDYWPTSLR